MKSYTDLEQSKKLAEILPTESADMYWWSSGKRYYIESIDDDDYDEDKDIRAWSLAALIDVLPDIITDEDGTIFGLNIKKNFIEYYNPSMGALCATYHSITAEDLVDAAYEMIIKLKEEGLL